MARSRRALLRKGNVTDIAEARKKREEKQQAREQALANARIGTLDEASRHADAIQAAIAAEASESQTLYASASGAAVNQASGQVHASRAMTGSVASSGAGSTIASSANTATASANDDHPIESAQTAPSVEQAPAASVTPEPAARREFEQESVDAAGKKARADKKNANRTFNREKVEAIKKAIANGTYQINATRTADRFIERESYS